MTYIADMIEYATIRSGGCFENPLDHGPSIVADDIETARVACAYLYEGRYEIFGPISAVYEPPVLFQLISLNVGNN